MAYQVTFDLTFSQARDLQPPYEASGSNTTGLISSSAEKMNEDGTVWRITRVWDAPESSNTYISTVESVRSGMDSPPTVSNIVRTNI